MWPWASDLVSQYHSSHLYAGSYNCSWSWWSGVDFRLNSKYPLPLTGRIPNLFYESQKKKEKRHVKFLHYPRKKFKKSRLCAVQQYLLVLKQYKPKTLRPFRWQCFSPFFFFSLFCSPSRPLASLPNPTPLLLGHTTPELPSSLISVTSACSESWPYLSLWSNLPGSAQHLLFPEAPCPGRNERPPHPSSDSLGNDFFNASPAGRQ